MAENGFKSLCTDTTRAAFCSSSASELKETTQGILSVFGVSSDDVMVTVTYTRAASHAREQRVCGAVPPSAPPLGLRPFAPLVANSHLYLKPPTHPSLSHQTMVARYSNKRAKYTYAERKSMRTRTTAKH